MHLFIGFIILVVGFLFASTENGLRFDLHPSKIVYLQQKDLSIVCKSEENNQRAVDWIIIKKHKYGHITPFVSFIVKGNQSEIEWGSHYQNTSKRVHVTGSKDSGNETSLKLDFLNVECEDEAEYQCVIEGDDGNGTLWKHQASDELIVYSIHGEPKITVESQTISKNEMIAFPGSDVTLLCGGTAGKPPVPLYWYKYVPSTGDYEEVHDGRGEKSVTLPLDDLCRYHVEQPLTYKVLESDPEATFKCRIGSYEKIFTIYTDLKKNKDVVFKGSYKRSHEKLTGGDVNGSADLRESTLITCALISTAVVTLYLLTGGSN